MGARMGAVTSPLLRLFSEYFSYSYTYSISGQIGIERRSKSKSMSMSMSMSKRLNKVACPIQRRRALP